MVRLFPALQAVVLGIAASSAAADPTAAHVWNEQLLAAIRLDTPRPTVHSRNLYHLSAAMYDAWSAYDPVSAGVFVDESATAADIDAARDEAISYAAYRVLHHRFENSVGRTTSLASFDATMSSLGYDANLTSTAGSSPAALGNRIAQTIIAQGMLDGSNEANNYAAPAYAPINQPLKVQLSGTLMNNPNRWQPLEFTEGVLQNGIPVGAFTQTAIGHHWGGVDAFALQREPGQAVYKDLGPPPRLGTATDLQFKLAANDVVRYSSMLDPGDGVTMDISPGAFGNNPLGSNAGAGRPINPATGQPYAANVVKRGDFGRALAEFWADGPQSETPPGHWNLIANEVSSNPLLQKRIGGSGPVVNDLEWDVKLYLALNGAVHDAAITAWNHKGYYDSARPISMIRYLAQNGQSSDPNLPSYHPQGALLEAGLVEVITPDTSAPGQRHAHLAGNEGDIAIRAWNMPAGGPTETGGVDWMLGKDWLPYQLPTFVSPAFAGYISGHSTFSRAAAEVMALFTGSAFFPGGLGEMLIGQGSLDFEAGPTDDILLQWATYYDAADQAGLSRIFGGIHIIADDLPGRSLGSAIGIEAFGHASDYFSGNVPDPGAFAVLLTCGGCLALRRARRRAAPSVTAHRTVRCTTGVFLVAALSASAGAATFTDVTTSAGLTYNQNASGIHAGGDSYAIRQTGGAAAGDYDGDSWIDLFVTRFDAPPILYRNRGDGTFADATSGAFSGLPATGSNGAAWGDVDNDGDRDLYVTSIESSRFHFFLNNGDGTFSERGVERGAALAGTDPHYGFSASMGDYDRDGFLDIHTTEWRENAQSTAPPNARLLHNLGASQPGHFVDATIPADVSLVAFTGFGQDYNSSSLTSRFSDLDGDGWADLFVAADFGGSQIFWNKGDGTFLNGTEDPDLGVTLSHSPSDMGQTIGDYDNDGDFDIFITTIDTNTLYRNEGGRSFSHQGLPAGVERGEWGWGTTFLDIDNDGDLDLTMTNGQHEAQGSTNERMRLWRNNGDGTFSEISFASGLIDRREGKGLLTFDYDNDGDLDIFTANTADAPVLYRNDSSELGHFLRIQAVGVESNRDGIGALITVIPDLENPNEFFIREIDGGSNFLAQNENIAHFGLGDVTWIDQIVIRWSNGRVQTVNGVAADQQLVVYEVVPEPHAVALMVFAGATVVLRHRPGCVHSQPRR